MADCPKCGQHLRMTDWKQHCPNCKCNVVIYDIQERLMQDADKAEVQYYHFQKKIDRLKASFIGSKLAVVRLFTSLIPVLAIIIPFFNGNFTEPFVPLSGSIGLFSFLDIIDALDVNAIIGLLNTADGKSAVMLLFASLVAFVLSIVIMLVHFGLLTISCSKKGKFVCLSLDTVMIVLSILGSVLLLIVPKNPYFEIDFIIAPLVYIALLGVNFGVDFAVFKKGIEVNHAPCFVGGIPIEEYLKMVEDGVPKEEIRAEMYRRLTKMQEEKDAELKGEGVKI